jgi:hypothetical protein
MADWASDNLYVISAPGGPPAIVSRVAKPTFIAPCSINIFSISSFKVIIKPPFL